MRRFLIVILLTSMCFADIFTSDIKPNADATLDAGASGLRWGTLYGSVFTDNTATWEAASLTGFISVTADDFFGDLTATTITATTITGTNINGTTITGTTITDGTAIMTGGVITAPTITGTNVNGATITGTTITDGTTVLTGGNYTSTGNITLTGSGVISVTSNDAEHSIFGSNDEAIGVEGASINGSGVKGRTTGGMGVYGFTSSGGIGVQGESNSGRGVYGKSVSDVGVYGESQTNYAGFFFRDTASETTSMVHIQQNNAGDTEDLITMNNSGGQVFQVNNLGDIACNDIVAAGIEGDSLSVLGTVDAATLTDGTTTITGGNYTGVGNITGTDVDISAGTGDYTSTGDLNIGTGGIVLDVDSTLGTVGIGTAAMSTALLNVSSSPTVTDSFIFINGSGVVDINALNKDYAILNFLGTWDNDSGNNVASMRGVNVQTNIAQPEVTYATAVGTGISTQTTYLGNSKVGFFTMDSYKHLAVLAPSWSDATVTEEYGLWIADINKGVTAVAIQTNGGKHEFMDATDIGDGTNETQIGATGNITQAGTAITTLDQLYLNETTTPTPVADDGAIYTKSTNELFFQDGDGAEHLLHGDAFSNIWTHRLTSVEVTISTQDVYTVIDSFTVVGHEDDLLNVVGNVSTNTLTLSAIAGGEYELSYHGSITATGGADKEMSFALGITLATPKDITNVTDNGVSPIVITSVGHSLENGDMVQIVGVLGNTAANGSFIVDSKATDTFVIVALDGSATTGNGDYNEGSPTGDITIVYPGNMEVHRMVRGADFGSISATGLHVLADSDVLSIYVANLSGVTNLTVSAISFSAFRIGD